MSGLPSRIGKYTVHERLGRGGMAEVYLAHDAKLDRLVALKLLREFGHDELLKRFEREARAIARLAHPNIVTIYELGDHDGRPFIAMEYIAGESLAELTRRRAVLALNYRLKLIEDLCAGLACAHRAGIVHRDVKPANLMVDNQGVLKVLDFGIVRMAGPGLTQMGTLVGTVNYMSPEQVSAESVDHRSDIFSVGAVFYELLSYRQAFRGTFVEVLSKIIHAEPVPLSELDLDLDAGLVAMVSRCLAKPPGARYQDLLTLRADVQRARQRLEGNERYAALDASYQQTIIVPTPTPTPRASTPAPGDGDDADREVDTWLRQAAEQLEAGQLARASDLIGRAALRAPDLPRVLALRRELERAVLEQERAEQRKRAVQASLQRAHAKLDDGAHQSASRAIAEALALDPRSSEALALRARVETALTAERKDEALRAAEAERERRHEERTLQQREEERRDREQRIATVLTAAREAIRDERFDEAAALVEQAPSDEAHASVVEALRRAASSGAERLRLARDAVARARALAGREQLAAALAVLDRDAPDHPLVSQARRDIRRGSTRQARAFTSGAWRVRALPNARAAAAHVAQRWARLRTGHARQHRQRWAIVGALALVVVVAAIVVVRWRSNAPSVLPTATRPTSSAPVATPKDTAAQPPASSTAPPQTASAPDRRGTGREIGRVEKEREPAAGPTASKPRPRASESARNQTRKDSAGEESAKEDGSGSLRSAAPERDTPSETDDAPRGNADTPSPSRKASATPAGRETASRASTAASAQTTARAAILRLLSEYEGAYSSLSEASVRQLQPSFEGFPQTYRTVLRSVTLTILNPSIDVAANGQSAIVKCFLSYDYVWKRGGLPPKGSRSVTWRVKKAGDSWVIVD